MQSKNGITVDVLNANAPNRIPLSVMLEGGLTLVKVPHGPIKVRVITPHPTDVSVVLDQKGLLACKVPAGVTELAFAQDGRPMTFQSAAELAASATTGGDTPAEPTVIPTEGFSEDVSPELLAGVVRDSVIGGEEALEAISTQPNHVSGLLLVSVKFSEQAPVPGIVPPPYDEDQLAFQMNPPEAHNALVAANFHKVVSPEKIEPRWCSCCRRLDERR